MTGNLRVGGALCVALFAGGYLLGGGPAVLGLALVAAAVVAGYSWSPSWRATHRLVAGARPRTGVSLPVWSGVRIGHERDAHVVDHERADGQGMEHLVEAEPPR
ncbi:hypothetical protein GCM10012280_10910 [Wenjunlia tyrosinilytica]|uniref:Uncharacterized protein n=1 Tax=Wenjunlia tyrosinilytica TaxID=1544741 RepID=A0A917ZGX0_9ACTN|nr:hypothetical protein GCM10012280_10910 [Wenjunlia tyrosinilytica]